MTITSETKFGTKDAPATRTQFTVGKTVAIAGQASLAGVTARRIKFPMQHAKKAPGAATSPVTTPTSTPS